MPAHIREKLNEFRIKSSLKKPGSYCDGGGLWLLVQSLTSRSWFYRYMRELKSHDMGLGPYPEITLAEARRRAAEARQLRAHGKDPLAEREATRVAARVNAAKSMTFRQCSAAYIASHEATWKNEKHRYQWRATLDTANEILGDLPVHEIDVGLVLRVLEPIWTTKNETASRLRGRIEAILDWATVRGYRTGANPAQWKGRLAHALPARARVRRVEHHAALPFDEIGAFMAALRKQDGTAARALEFTILTAARTNETIGATWAEIDLDAKIWIVPGPRMKAKKEHRVALSDAAIALLTAIKPDDATADQFVFPGRRAGKPLSNMSMLVLLRRMGRDDLTVHGFRSTFSDWAAERTAFPREVVEMALAHAIGNAVEAAYRRGDLFAKRRHLAAAWAKSCASPSAKNSSNVTALRWRERAA